MLLGRDFPVLPGICVAVEFSLRLNLRSPRSLPRLASITCALTLRALEETF